MTRGITARGVTGRDTPHGSRGGGDLLARRPALARSHARRRGMLATMVSVGSALVMLAAGSGWLLTGYISSHLRRVNADTCTGRAGRAGEHPARGG